MSDTAISWMQDTVEQESNRVDWPSLVKAGLAETGPTTESGRDESESEDAIGYRLTPAGWSALFGMSAVAAMHVSQAPSHVFPTKASDQILRGFRTWMPYLATQSAVMNR
jgi:hypothetical protein